MQAAAKMLTNLNSSPASQLYSSHYPMPDVRHRAHALNPAAAGKRRCKVHVSKRHVVVHAQACSLSQLLQRLVNRNDP